VYRLATMKEVFSLKVKLYNAFASRFLLLFSSVIFCFALFKVVRWL